MANEFTEMGQALDAAVASREPAQEGGTSTAEDQSQQIETGNGTPQSDAREVEGGASNRNTAKPQAKQGGENQRAINYRNAARRLDRKRDNSQNTVLRQRIQQLEAEKQELLSQQDERSQMLAEQKQAHIQDLMAMQASQRYQAWSDKAYDNFGEDAENFLQLSEKWGNYVNQSEPELAKMIHRPYGQQLYYAWLERMENAKTRDEWVSMTRYERSKVLTDFYKKIEDHFNGLDEQEQQGTQNAPTPQGGREQTPPTQQVEAPVPGGGRNTSTLPPTNNFGLALQQAMNRRGVSERTF